MWLWSMNEKTSTFWVEWARDKIIGRPKKHIDQFLVEIFQDHGFKEWISLRIVAMQSDNVTF